jgi:hypothetical protein
MRVEHSKNRYRIRAVPLHVGQAIGIPLKGRDTAALSPPVRLPHLPFSCCVRIVYAP